MKKAVVSFLLMGLVASVGLGASGPEEKKTQISLGGSLLMLTMGGGDSTLLIGAALRVDFNLGRSFIIAPEISAGIGGASAGGTVNFRSGRYFAGLGGLVVSVTEGGSGGEWGTNGFFKVHAGIKGPRGLLAASFIVGGYIKGFGLTAGYVF